MSQVYMLPQKTKQAFKNRVKDFFADKFADITQINRMYAVPRIKTKGWVGIALLCLRLYLFFLIAILVYKFYTLVR